MDSKKIIQNEEVPSKAISELESMKNMKVEDHNETKSVTSEFLVKTKKDDLTLTVGNSKLFVNRSVLSLASPVFEEMLDTNSSDKSLDEIQLEGKKYDDVCEFIRCIHPGKIKKVSGENVDQVFPLACEYKVEHLMKACAEVFRDMLTPTPSATVIIDILVKANQYGLGSLKEMCLEMLRNKPADELDNAKIQCDKNTPAELKNVLQALVIKKLRTELEKTRQMLQASMVLNNIVGRFSQYGTQLVVSQKLNNAVGWCKEFELSLVGTYIIGQCFEAQFGSWDLRVSFEAERMSNKIFPGTHATRQVNDLLVNLENAHVSDKCTSRKAHNFIITFVVKNWMRDKQDHVVNWKTSIKSRSPKQSKSVGTLDQLETETNGFIYKSKMECEIYILQTEMS